MIVASTDDTDPAIKALLIEGYRRMSPSQKLERVRALTRAVQELALANAPPWSAEERPSSKPANAPPGS